MGPSALSRLEERLDTSWLIFNTILSPSLMWGVTSNNTPTSRRSMVRKGFCGVAEPPVDAQDPVANGTFLPTDIEAVLLSVVSKIVVERQLVEVVCCNRSEEH